VDRVSQNEGAESTLSFLISLAEMQALQSSLTSFKEAGDGEYRPEPRLIAVP
jgi:hypothetical protein